MEITLTTPALLFPAISLLLLAYSNRFLAIAALIRNLHAKYQVDPQPLFVGQITNLKKRLWLIQGMQFFGVASLLLCVLCMFLLFIYEVVLGHLIFGISLILMIISLALSIREIQISVRALEIQLEDMKQDPHLSKKNK